MSTAIIIDTKTTSKDLKGYYFRQFENSPQLSAYAYAGKELCSSCDSIQIDAIHIPWEAKKTNFVRTTFPRSDTQVLDWLNYYINRTNEILQRLKVEDKKTAFYQDPARCNDFGGCPFLSLCLYGELPAILSLYKPVPPREDGQARSKPEERKFSPTTLESSSCLRRYYFSKIKEITLKGKPNLAALFGQAIHSGVGKFYSSQQGFALLERKRLSLEAFCQTWDRLLQEEEATPIENYTQATGIGVLDKYTEVYKDDPIEYDPQFIETPIWLEMPNDTLLGMRIDRLRRD